MSLETCVVKIVDAGNCRLREGALVELRWTEVAESVNGTSEAQYTWDFGTGEAVCEAVPHADPAKVQSSAYFRVAREGIRLAYKTLEQHNPELAEELNSVQGKVVDYMLGHYWDKGGVA